MDLESFAVTRSSMNEELFKLVSTHTESLTATNLVHFCQTLTDYLACSAVHLKPPPTNDLLTQALAFSNAFGKNPDKEFTDIKKFKDMLGELYIPLIKRLTEEYAYLAKELPANQSPDKSTSRQLN